MPAPAYEAKSSTGEQYAAVFVPAIPAGTTSGDLLLACCWMTTTATDSAPTGWTQALAVSNASGAFLNVFWKIAAASESAPTFSAGSESYSEAILYRFSGTRGSSPVDVTGTDTGTLAAPSVTTTVDNTLVLHLFGSSSGGGASISAPAGDTALDEPANFYCSLSSGYTAQTSSGPTGTAAFDDGAMTTDQVTATVAIAPPAAAPTGGIVLEKNLQHFWPLSDQDGSDVWAGDAFDNPPSPSVGTLSNAATSPHAALGATRLTNDGSTLTAVWQATSAAFDPAEYTFAGWMRPVYSSVVQRGFQAGMDPSQNNIVGITRHSDNAKTYGLDGGGGLATRDISPATESGAWQFVCVRVSASEVILSVDADPPVTDQRGTVRSPGSVNWRLFINGDGASVVPVEYHGWGVWDRVLSDDEVAALQNSGTAIAFPLLTNGEPATALSLELPDDMTPRLLPQPASLLLAAANAVSPVLADAGPLLLQLTGDLAPPVLPAVTGLTLAGGSVSSPSLPAGESLLLAAEPAISPVVPQPAVLTLQPAADMTPPLLPSVTGLRLEPVILGPELPETIAGLQLAVGEPGPVLPSAPALTLRPESLSGELMANGPLRLSFPDTLFAGFSNSEPLTLSVGRELVGPNDLQLRGSLTLAVATSLSDARLLAATELLRLSLSTLPGTLRAPVLLLPAADLDDAPLLTVPRKLILRSDRFVTQSFERVRLTGLRSHRARLQSLAVTN